MNTQESLRPMSMLRNKAKRLVLFAVAATSVSLLAAPGLSYANEAQHSAPMMGMHSAPMMGMHGLTDPAKMDKHLERLFSHLGLDLSDSQKSRLKTIASAAATEMKTFHEQHKVLRKAQMTILTDAIINRTALEQNRLDAMRLMDQMSAAKSRALADAAEVLTPAQRTKVAEMMKARMARHADHGRFLKSPFGK